MQQALSLAYEAGNILLENGAEISRVEDSMNSIADGLGAKDHSFFILSNGIIATGDGYAKAKFIPIKGTQLAHIVAVNQLSRDAADGLLDLESARRRIDQIRSMPGKPWWEFLLGIALGVSAFCILFGGSLIDSAVTFAVGLVVGAFMHFASPHLSRIFGNLFGGMLGGFLCIVAARLGLGQHLPNMIIGTIIALVPGVPFTNGFRDIANEDYIAGATRLLDAFMLFLCIAGGVCLAFATDGIMHGGILQLDAPQVDPLTSHYAIQLAAAFVGTVGFSILFGAPRSCYLDCGLAGMAGWLVYLLMLRQAGLTPAVAAFAGAFCVDLTSHLTARLRKCPSSVYLICGIIPLVPGGGIFWTAYYLTTDQLHSASATGITAIKITIAIAIAIITSKSLINKLKRHRPKAA